MAHPTHPPMPMFISRHHRHHPHHPTRPPPAPHPTPPHPTYPPTNTPSHPPPPPLAPELSPHVRRQACVCGVSGVAVGSATFRREGRGVRRRERVVGIPRRRQHQGLARAQGGLWGFLQDVDQGEGVSFCPARSPGSPKHGSELDLAGCCLKVPDRSIGPARHVCSRRPRQKRDQKKNIDRPRSSLEQREVVERSMVEDRAEIESNLDYQRSRTRGR